MKNKFTTICLFLFLLLPCWLFGDNVISQLMSGDSLEIQRAKEYLFSHYSTVSESQRKDYVNGLILIIDSPDTVADTMGDHFQYAFKHRLQPTPSDMSRMAAIEIAGQLRITETLPVLAKHLNYVTTELSPIVWMSDPPLRDYPCADAMARMGDTAIPYLVTILKDHFDWDTRILAGKTIFCIKHSTDTTPIKEILNQTTDTTERQNLDEFIHLKMGHLQWYLQSHKQ